MSRQNNEPVILMYLCPFTSKYYLLTATITMVLVLNRSCRITLFWFLHFTLSRTHHQLDICMLLLKKKVLTIAKTYYEYLNQSTMF